MASLTTLPAEILRHILIDALVSECDPPACPPESQDRTRLSRSVGVWIKTRNLENTVLPLLLVNRLINGHVQAITTTRNSLQNCALDVMFVKMAGLWPTWTRVPFLTQHVDTVHATFRIFNPAPDLDSQFARSGLLGRGNGGRQRGEWNFYYLLTSFLQDGPLARSVQRYSPATCRYTIRNLIIDVLVPPEDEDHTVTGLGALSTIRGVMTMGETFSLDKPEGWQGPPSLEPRIEPAEKLGLFLYGWISRFLTLSTEADHAIILYEGILDSIEFRIDGEVRCHINMEDALLVAEPLRSLTRGRSQRERFRQWKEWVTEKRRLGRLGRGPPGKRPHDTIQHFPYDKNEEDAVRSTSSNI